MSRPISDDLVRFVAAHEGFRAEAYPDPGSADGTPLTLGYGQTTIDGRPVRRGDTISHADAKAWLEARLRRDGAKIERLVKVPLTDAQFGALVSFAYNVGIGAFKSSTLLRRLNQRRYADVPAQMMRWVYNDGKRMGGLENRRRDEVDFWLDGNAGAGHADGKPLGPQVAPAPAPKPQSKVADAVLDPKKIAGVAAAATPVISAASGLDGPIMWAIAGVIVITAVGGVIYALRRMEDAK